MSDTTADVVDDGAAAAPATDPATEARARNMGWTPREQYRGEPERWIDAATFVERGERMLPLLQERNRALDRTVTELKGQMGQQQEMLGDLVSRTRKAEKIGYERAMRELQQKRVEAVSQGDTEAFQKAEQEMRELGPPPEPEPQRQQPNGAAQQQAPNPVVTAWVRRNSWFNTDRVANAAAVAALSEIEQQYPGEDLADHLVKVEERVAQIFPQHFPNRRQPARPNGNGYDEEEPLQDTRRRTPSMVAPSSSAPERRPGPRSFEAIPAEHRKEYERQRKMLEGKGDPFTKEEYARYYWEAEGEA